MVRSWLYPENALSSTPLRSPAGSASPRSGSGAVSDGDLAGRGSGSSDDRISRLSAAILRISQSLDLATVLEDAVESAGRWWSGPTGRGSSSISRTFPGRSGWRTFPATFTRSASPLEAYLETYNRKRPHRGRAMEGRTPYQVFKAGLTDARKAAKASKEEAKTKAA